jgi:hypothetical protein
VQFTIILVWVDNLVIFTDSPDTSHQIEKKLISRFNIKVMGKPSILLGMKISCEISEEQITLSQAHYTDAILKKFRLINLNPVTMPLNPYVKLESENSNINNAPSNQGSGLYATAIGLLMYTALGTRPDIAYAVQTLAQYTQNPQPVYWTGIKRIFRYLKGTQDFTLTYDHAMQNLSPGLQIYCDAD